jgi:hypothetical protein
VRAAICVSNSVGCARHVTCVLFGPLDFARPSSLSTLSFMRMQVRVRF